MKKMGIFAILLVAFVILGSAFILDGILNAPVFLTILALVVLSGFGYALYNNYFKRK